MTEYDSIDDVFVPENMNWGTILECDYCGHTGIMYGTHEPRETQFWDCDECGRTDVPHRILLTTDSVEELKDATGSGGGPDDE